MFAIVMIVITVVTGLYWGYDAIANAPRRRKEEVKEPGIVAYSRGIFLIALVITLIKVFKVGILPLLVILTIASFIVWMIDKAFFKKKREAAKRKEPLLIDYSRSLFPIFLIVLLLRAFVAQPFVVPTGSLEPTIMPGDFVLVTQYSYGLRLPITHTKILNVGMPKLGDIVVFRNPAVPGMDLIKRVAGLPGDHVVYKNKVLYINGKEMKQTFLRNGTDFEPMNIGGNVPSKVMSEDLAGVKHEILLHDTGGELTNFNFVVPKGYYFMLGDNRDDSADSRFWGFMPASAIIGKAQFIFFSMHDFHIRWSRIGNKL